jgi:hypothetical protein
MIELDQLGRVAAIATILLLLAWGLPASSQLNQAPPASQTVGNLAPLLPSVTADGHSGASASAAEAPATGAGVFFNSSALPLPARSVRDCLPNPVPQCPSSDLLNVSTEVASNFTSRGILVEAYTSLTNASSCPTVANYTRSQVTFVRSLDGGATWSRPQLMGAPDCVMAATLPSSWQPAITSLANGTLLLVYSEYNSTCLVPYLYSCAPPISDLLLTVSFTGGSNWTTPVVLNGTVDPSLSSVSYAQLRPSLTTVGRTVYLSWMAAETTGNATANSTSTSISLLVSTDAGASWSPVVPLTTSPTVNYGNPEVVANASGSILLAYTAGLPYSAAVWLATSTDNFTSWNNRRVATTVNEPLPGPFTLASPQLAFDAAHHEWYLAWLEVDQVGCPLECANLSIPLLYTSVDGGTHWTRELAAQQAFFRAHLLTSFTAQPASPSPYAEAGVYNLAIGVTQSSHLEMVALYSNQSLCFGDRCGYLEEEVVTSSDRGSSFTGPYVLNGTPAYAVYGWPGESSSVTIGGDQVWYSWTLLTCPRPGSASGPTPCASQHAAGGPAQSQVVVSRPYTGRTLTATFTASGLNNSTLWSVDLLGNIRIGSGTARLRVGGVPLGQTIFWVLPGPNNTSTSRFYATSQSIYPATFPSGTGAPSSNFTDTVSFQRFVPFSIGTAPNGLSNPALYPPSCVSVYEYPTPPWSEYEALFADCVDVAVSPASLGTTAWVPYGVPIAIGVQHIDLLLEYCTPTAAWYFFVCLGQFENVTFLSWTGSGPGAVSARQPNITVTPLGPVEETLNLVEVDSCQWVQSLLGFYTPLLCTPDTTSLNFTEHGLPSGVRWGISAMGATGTDSTVANTSSTLLMPSLTVDSLCTFEAWTIPTADPDLFWVGLPSVGSEIIEPNSTPIVVDYTLSNLAGTNFTLYVRERGLPNGTLWRYTVTSGTLNVSYAAFLPWSNLTLPAGAIYNVSPSFNPGNASLGYVATNLTVDVDAVNATTESTFGNTAHLQLLGDATVSFVYGPAWWVSVLPGLGGSTSPASGWVAATTLLELSATPDPGYLFEGWTGTGLGASSFAQRLDSSVNITPEGPVTEVASFAPRPAPTWSVNVSEEGMPPTQPFTIDVGLQAYTGEDSFLVTNLSTGSYRLGAPDVLNDSTGGMRFAPGPPTTTLPVVSSGVAEIDSNGSITVAYATEYLVNVVSTPGGTVDPEGAHWESAGVQLSLSANAGAGYQFDEWSGVSPGLAGLSTSSVQLTVDRPITATASFSPVSAPAPATYTLVVRESGLPIGTSWDCSVGATGRAGTDVLEVSGLRGGYTLTVPTVYQSAGVRFLPNGSSSYSAAVDLSSNVAWAVHFQEQVLVTVQTSGRGTVLADGSGWVPVGSQVLLLALAQPGSNFAGWSGTGKLSVTGSRPYLVLHAEGPILETAAFTSSAASATPNPRDASWLDALRVVLVAEGGLLGVILMLPRSPLGPDGSSHLRPAVSRPRTLAIRPARPPPKSNR